VPGARGENYYSLPNFHGDSVIYVQNNALMRMGADGTGKKILFPPQKNKKPLGDGVR